MHYKILLLVVVMVVISIHEAHAQTPGVPAGINQTGCMVLSFDNVENPFVLTLDHDPTLTESVSHTTTNPTAALQTIGTDPNQSLQGLNPKTHLSFASNDTTNWTIVVQLTHPNDKSGPRTLLLNLFSKQNNPVSTNNHITYSGNTFCGIFQIQAIPPVHIQTNAEILALAQKMENLTIGTFAGNVKNYADRAETSGNNSGFLGLGILIIAMVMIVSHRADKRNLAKQEENAKNATLGFKNATMYVNATRKHLELEIHDMMNRHDETHGFILEQFVNSANSTIRGIHNALEDWALYIKTNKVEHIRVPETPQEIVLPVILPEDVPEEKKNDYISKIPLVGKFMDKKKAEEKKKDDLAEFWYQEFRKNLGTKYKGKFREMSETLYPLAVRDPEARAKVEAMYRIITEDGGWPE